MDCVGILSGGAPVLKKYQVAASVTALGIPLLGVAANGGGLALGTTTSSQDMVGINLDLATYGAAQLASGASPEALCTVLINPDAVLLIPMSGAAAAGTAITTLAATSASTTGLDITTGTSWTGTERDEGMAWCESGANAGQMRKIGSTSGTAGTVVVAFQNDIAIGDVFSWAPVFNMTNQTITLCTELTEFRQDVAVATNTATYQCLEMHPRNWLGTGRRPFGLFIAADHILNRGP